MYVSKVAGLNHVKQDIGRDLFLHVMIHSFLNVMIHTLEERKVGGKHIILTQLACVVI